ncbi:hypothetical protein ASG29_06630 [Sphingomonas sp. Leaf412]|uniref:hypothetical protein n=1 Tax=Sphingomonas sp. Leaf412 TaxID=1736370 RepID=UPI0006F9DE8B|nr:hypothetical protein [Sphingomonas sp. Leaf412]KQT33682.1 hypothetical protein ASG29_06630 [Sphingomonas sp. Leaf412]
MTKVVGLMLLAMSLATALLRPGVAAAQRLIVEPSTVTLAAGDEGRVLVRVEGGGVARRSIAVSGPASVRWTARRFGSAQWVLELEARPGFDGEATAIVEAKDRRRTLATPLMIKARPSPAASALLSAGLSFEGETLLDGFTRPLLVRLSNLSDLPLDMTLRPALPAFLAAGEGEWSKGRRVAAHSSVIVPIPVSTAGSGDHPVASGKHKVAVIVAARRVGSPAWSGQVVADAELSVGVPGMAEVQGVLQVPSFLLFPGFLLVSAFALTTRLLRRPAAGAGPSADGKESLLSLGWSAGHWLVAISLSMILVWIYPGLMKMWLGSRRDILYGFDLGDVIRVWIISIATGILAALLTAAVASLVARRRAAAAFNQDLAPIELLERLASRKSSALLPFVTLDDDSRIYSLESAAGAGQAWVASAIELNVLDRSRPEFDALELARRIRAGDPKELSDHLANLVAAGAIRLDWTQAGDVRGVGIVPAARLDQTEGPGSIVTQR